MLTADNILAEPAARRLSLARDAAAALAANGWRVVHAAVHSGGTADVAAERAWSRGKLTARARLIIHCHSSSERLVLSLLANPSAGERLPYYSFGDDDPSQRRAIASATDAALVERLHAAAYPREISAIERAHLDALPARARAAAVREPVLDEAFKSIDAVRRDLFQHDLDVVRDDFELDRDFAAQAAVDAAYRCDLIYPIAVTDAELWSLPETKRRDWIRVERSSLVGRQRQWIDVVEGSAFAAYADALTRHVTAAYRRRRFAPAGASSRS